MDSFDSALCRDEKYSYPILLYKQETRHIKQESYSGPDCFDFFSFQFMLWWLDNFAGINALYTNKIRSVNAIFCCHVFPIVFVDSQRRSSASSLYHTLS